MNFDITIFNFSDFQSVAGHQIAVVVVEEVTLASIAGTTIVAVHTVNNNNSDLIKVLDQYGIVVVSAEIVIISVETIVTIVILIGVVVVIKIETKNVIFGMTVDLVIAM